MTAENAGNIGSYMKTELEIQYAHDLVGGVLSGKAGIPLDSGEARTMLIGAFDALCWVLGHDHNLSFEENLRTLYVALQDKGIVMERKTKNP